MATATKLKPINAWDLLKESGELATIVSRIKAASYTSRQNKTHHAGADQINAIVKDTINNSRIGARIEEAVAAELMTLDWSKDVEL